MRKRTETYYRRHRDCARGYTGFTYEPDERRNWKPCLCKISFYGRLRPEDDQPIRRNTAATDWRDAEEVVERWRAGLPDPEPEPPKPVEPGKTTIAAAGKAYLAEHERIGSARNTIRRYRLMLRKVEAFASDQKHYLYPEQWTMTDVRELLVWWGGKPQTQVKNLAGLKAFFEFCVENKWMKENVARIRSRKNRTMRAAMSPRQRSPFTDAELATMLRECEQIERCGYFAGGVTSEDVSDFILVSIYTGLRISDVATFDASRLQDSGDLHIRALKNGAWMSTWVPEWLQDRIRARAARIGSLIFGRHNTDDINVITETWRRKLRSVWDLCGEWGETPTHHRFRHTFVRILLQRGVDIGTVADLIGDTPETVRRHYSKWVPERQDRVRAVLREAFADAPMPRAVNANVLPFKK